VKGGSIVLVEGVTVIPSALRVALLTTTREVPHFDPDASDTVYDADVELPAATDPLVGVKVIDDFPEPTLVEGLK
jgi:hypothetical protein